MSLSYNMLRILTGTTAFILFAASMAGASQITLKECLEQALKNNPALKITSNDSLIQSENVALVKSSYYPRLDLQAGYTALLAPQAIKTTGGSFETQQPDFAFASLSLYQTLYDFGRRDRRKEQ